MKKTEAAETPYANNPMQIVRLPFDAPQSLRQQRAQGALVDGCGAEARHAFLFVPGIAIEHRESVETRRAETGIDCR